MAAPAAEFKTTV